MKIGFLGPNGSFSHQVTQAAFPREDLQPYSTITEVIKAYESHQVDYAIVPVENSIEGSVHETLDYLFHQAKIHSVAEIIQPIKQQLLATRIDQPINKVFSHPQAIAQGKKYINEHYPHAEIEMTASTAFAARFVAQHPDQPYAAIAPHASAEEYGLQVVAYDIQEMDENITRFWILGKELPSLPLKEESKKMTLALTLPDNLPGALYKALAIFAWRGITLTKIESRPLKTAMGEYFFIIDVDWSDSPLIQYAFEELKAVGIDYKTLGSYCVYRVQEVK